MLEFNEEKAIRAQHLFVLASAGHILILNYLPEPEQCHFSENLAEMQRISDKTGVCLGIPWIVQSTD